MAHTPGPSDTPNPGPPPSSGATPREQIAPFAGSPNEPPAAAFPGYEFLRELGRGGMGVVYLARNRLLDRLEAVKVLSRPWSETRFRQEVRASARLRHPNVVTVYAALVAESSLAFAMEYVEGENLARLVRTAGPLSPRLACSYVRQAALGLQHAHEQGMTHRDVKPQNMMLCRADGRDTVKILDFGLAKIGAADAGEPTTIDGELLGTPGYAAPEQFRDAGAADIRSDVYGLGVTLWFLLTGNQPVEDNPPEKAAGADGRGWPAGLSAVLARMTAWNPADRYQTPADVAAALEPFAHESARPAAKRRRRRWAWVAALALLLSGLGAATLTWSDAPAPDAVASDAPVPPTAQCAADPVFVSAFNGIDLTGWVVDGPDDQWWVEAGAITTTGTRNGPKTWLLTARDYGDVRVRFEYQLEPGANTGFAFRAVPGERPVLRAGDQPTRTAYHQQVELSDDKDKGWESLPTGQINGGLGKYAASIKPKTLQPWVPRLAPEWNTAEFELIGQSLKLTVNGEEIQAANLNQLIDAGSLYPALKRARGRIGFQQQAKTVRFRNVEILELPSGP